MNILEARKRARTFYDKYFYGKLYSQEEYNMIIGDLTRLASGEPITITLTTEGER